MTSFYIRGLSAAFMFGLFASTASAQTAPYGAPPPAYGTPPSYGSPPAYGAAPAPYGQRQGPDRQRMQAMMQQRRAERARDLHTLLGIRPDQEAAFSAFEASMSQGWGQGWGQGKGWGHGREAPGALIPTPQRLDEKLSRMEQHLTRMRQRIEAVKAFYAVLSPDQQHIFDILQKMHEHGHRGMKGRMGGGMWGRKPGEQPMGPAGGPPRGY